MRSKFLPMIEKAIQQSQSKGVGAPKSTKVRDILLTEPALVTEKIYHSLLDIEVPKTFSVGAPLYAMVGMGSNNGMAFFVIT